MSLLEISYADYAQYERDLGRVPKDFAAWSASSLPDAWMEITGNGFMPVAGRRVSATRRALPSTRSATTPATLPARALRLEPVHPASGQNPGRSASDPTRAGWLARPLAAMRRWLRRLGMPGQSRIAAATLPPASAPAAPALAPDCAGYDLATLLLRACAPAPAAPAPASAPAISSTQPTNGPFAAQR